MIDIIAEIGINHDGNIHLAHELIRQASICGATVAKFQSYSVDALFHPQTGTDPDKEIWENVKHLELTMEQLLQCKQWCSEEGIEFMCSVFDSERLGWIEGMGVSRHKIASRTSKFSPDLVNEIVRTGKECLMSLGFDAQKVHGQDENIKYLYCVSEYPTEYGSLDMPTSFGPEEEYYGFSDHSMGIEASLVAIGRGARVIEKHFTLNKASSGFDHICSITPVELELLSRVGKQMNKVVEISR